VVKGVDEPYRMFTSRAEHRLLLREDNADLRLREHGRRVGLVSDEQWERFLRKKDEIERELTRLKETRINPGAEAREKLARLSTPAFTEPFSLAQLLRRPELSYRDLVELSPGPAELSPPAAEEVEIMIKYEGYLEREREAVERMKRMEEERLPPDLNYFGVPGLSREVQAKLERVRPRSLGQALRIPGVTPAAVAILQVMLKAGGTGRRGRLEAGIPAPRSAHEAGE